MQAAHHSAPGAAAATPAATDPSRQRAFAVVFVVTTLVWTLSALDFFLVAVNLPMIAPQLVVCSPLDARDCAQLYHPDILTATWAIALTLLTRPVGAFFLGAFAERRNRRVLLMIAVAIMTVAQVATAIPIPDFWWFLLWRAVTGIGMGGAWALGAPLAMEWVLDESGRRGLYSGIFQQGYPLGHVSAALLVALIPSPLFPWGDWHISFAIAGGLGLVLLFFCRYLREPPGIEEQAPADPHPRTPPGILAMSLTRDTAAPYRARVAAAHIRLDVLDGWWNPFWTGVSKARSTLCTVLKNEPRKVAYAVVLAALLNLLSHGTQDLYKIFLSSQVLQRESSSVDSAIIVATLITVLGAILGGLFFGYRSDEYGRRRCIVVTAVVGLLLVPLWTGVFPWGWGGPQGAAATIWSGPGLLLTLGAFLMQFMVQGAFGVTPAHLTEIAPKQARYIFPGVVYHLGFTLVAFEALAIAWLAQSPLARSITHGGPGYSSATVWLAVVFVLVIATVFVLGRGYDPDRPAVDDEENEQAVTAAQQPGARV